ncbi:axonemal dynein light intermediate polypeptide 1-like [Pungitius pungitius]|uniref:axonemal dynein light intermediate polypeptide 1-like n=1 Tax=Pungitius pungitius TaxID=134920 RepID=UPI002E0F6DF9
MCLLLFLLTTLMESTIYIIMSWSGGEAYLPIFNSPSCRYPLTVLVLSDELNRVLTIQCAERGSLLLRVRDQVQKTFTAYQTLYESAMFFGVRKTLLAEVDMIDRRRTSSEVEEETPHLRKRVKELRADTEAAEESDGERRRAENEERQEEIEMLKGLNQQLKMTFLFNTTKKIRKL